MTKFFKPLLVSVLLAGASAVTIAQAPASGDHHGRMDPAKMQQRMAERQADLKAKLGLNAAQQAAWSTYVTATQPPAGKAHNMGRDERQKRHAEMQALTTPERIDRMAAMHAERQAEMTRRGNATKAFYAALDPDQQKIFDEHSRHRRGGHHGHGSHGKTKPHNS